MMSELSSKSVLAAAALLVSSLAGSPAWGQASGPAAPGSNPKGVAAEQGLERFATPDICRAMIATVQDRKVGDLRADMATIGLVVSYPAKSNGSVQNYKCYVDTTNGKAQWATDSGAWQSPVTIRTDSAGRLVVEVPSQQVRTFSLAELSAGH